MRKKGHLPILKALSLDLCFIVVDSWLVIFMWKQPTTFHKDPRLLCVNLPLPLISRLFALARQYNPAWSSRSLQWVLFIRPNGCRSPLPNPPAPRHPIKISSEEEKQTEDVPRKGGGGGELYTPLVAIITCFFFIIRSFTITRLEIFFRICKDWSDQIHNLILCSPNLSCFWKSSWEHSKDDLKSN